MIQKRYSEIRDRIKSGHVVLYRGSGLIPGIIKCWSWYTHAALIVRLDEYEGLKDRIFTVEMMGDGMRLSRLSERLNNSFIMFPNVNTEMANRFSEYALTTLAGGRKYDYGNLLQQAVASVLPRAAKMDHKKYICSEWVYQAWVDCGGLPARTQAPDPEDLTRCIGGEIIKVV